MPSHAALRDGPRHTFDPADSISFLGGSRVGWWNASIPLAEPWVDQTWAYIGGFLPVWIERSAVTARRKIHGIVKKMLAHGYTGYLLIEQAPPLNRDTLLADLTRAYQMFKPYER